jgi:signal transduction histidine kinase
MEYLDAMGTFAQGTGPSLRDRAQPGRVAEQEAALRRVANLVAGGASSAEVFGAVATEVATVMRLPLVGIGRYDQEGASVTVIATWTDRVHHFQPGTRWSLDGLSVIAEVHQTGRSARIDDYSDLPGTLAGKARSAGLTSSAGVPIIVDDRVWGLMVASSDDVLPNDVEARLAEFAEPLATALANSQARQELARMAEEQAALRRVATLVARGVPATQVFEAVIEDVGRLVGADGATLARYEADLTVTIVGAWSKSGPTFTAGTRFPLEEGVGPWHVLETRRPARTDSYEGVAGPAAAKVRELGWRSSVSAPVIVDRDLWGVATVISTRATPLPVDTEDRLAEFTELLATAIANAESREELAALAEQESALRRVATLVARGASSNEVFAAVAEEVAEVLHLTNTAVCRYDEGAVMTVLAVCGIRPETFEPGSRWPLDGPSMSAEVLRTGRPARFEDYTHLPGSLATEAREYGFSRVAGAPIIVDGQVWGVISTSSPDEPLADHLEDRLAEFTELVGTAIANSQAREEVTRLAEEQAALGRVATIVAEGAPPAEVFEAVSAEVAQLAPADGAAVSRFESDGTVTALGGWTNSGGYVYVGRRYPLEGTVSALVLETRGPARLDNYADAPGLASKAAREMGWRSAVGAPITVEGRLWGVLAIVSKSERPLPLDTERRLAEFTELVATAIANAESRAELKASRARIVATTDATRRRIERDLHDGAQQRLVSLALELRAAQAGAPPELGEHRAELSHIAEGLTNVLDGLREIALGLHPAILAEGGLGPALKTLANRSPIPVELDVRIQGRLPEPAEVTAYYSVSEALTNAAKHAEASIVHVSADAGGGTLIVAVRDDGVGGADPSGGSGLLGLKDRAEAIGGRISLQSPHSGGTMLRVELPLGDCNSSAPGGR